MQRQFICFICLEYISGSDHIYQCEECWGIFHSICVKKWIQNNDINNNKVQTTTNTCISVFKCPNCRNTYNSETIKKGLDTFSCFCGKVTNSNILIQSNNNKYTHCCSNICNKILDGHCILHTHPCPDTCHPGKCKKCSVPISTFCYCGAISKSLPCFEVFTLSANIQDPKNRTIDHLSNKYIQITRFSCNRNKCFRLLNCGNGHRCLQICHSGTCPPCSRCDLKLQSSLLTNTDNTSVNKIVFNDKTMNMNTNPMIVNNSLALLRNWETQGEIQVEKTCPCGKQHCFLLESTQPPPCWEICNATLSCGVHKCRKTCHYGSCGECTVLIQKICRCGKSKSIVQCSAPFFCNSVCTKVRSCAIHICNQKCCISCPPCNEVCNKPLDCGLHKCEKLCHPSDVPCSTCNQTYSVSCACGMTVISDILCSVKVDPPTCILACRKSVPCYHNPPKHICHFGPCPPCNLICDKPLCGCEHKCSLYCHSSDSKNSPCPPCQVIITRTCYGNHESKTVVCSAEPKEWSCGLQCGKPLTCGNHFCALSCHSPSTPCAQCNRFCQKKRENCSHIHAAPCHNSECPPCNEIVKVRCVCGLLEFFVSCSELFSLSVEEKLRRFRCVQPCSKALPFCTHLCPVVCHSGSCPNPTNCQKKVVVRCQCRRKKESWICSDAQKYRKKFNFPNSHLLFLECDDSCKKAASTKQANQSPPKIVENESPRLHKQTLNVGTNQSSFISSTNPSNLLGYRSKKRNLRPPNNVIFKSENVYYKIFKKVKSFAAQFFILFLVILFLLFCYLLYISD